MGEEAAGGLHSHATTYVYQVHVHQYYIIASGGQRPACRVRFSLYSARIVTQVLLYTEA